VSTLSDTKKQAVRPQPLEKRIRDLEDGVKRLEQERAEPKRLVAPTLLPM
jgi:hypothetical protein